MAGDARMRGAWLARVAHEPHTRAAIRATRRREPMPLRSLDTTELTWPEIRDAIAAGYDTILVAAGSTEQHGPHLPEMTDTLIGTYLVRAIVARLPNALQGPTIS